MKGAAKEKRVELLLKWREERSAEGGGGTPHDEKLIAAENLSEGVSVETISAPRGWLAWVRGWCQAGGR